MNKYQEALDFVFDLASQLPVEIITYTELNMKRETLQELVDMSTLMRKIYENSEEE